VTTLYFGTGVTDFTGVKTFFDAIKANFPNGLTFTYPTTVDVINEATGQLTGSVVGTTLASTVSITTASVYSGVSGAIVRWNTGLIQNGKRVTGRTFLVPLVKECYDTNGTLASGTISGIQTAAAALLSGYGDGLKVWSRPYAGAPGTGEGARAGIYATVIGQTVPDLAVVLRSRRT